MPRRRAARRSARRRGRPNSARSFASTPALHALVDPSVTGVEVTTGSRGSIHFVLFIEPAPAPAHPQELAARRGSTILLAGAELSGLSSLRLARGEARGKASEQTNGEYGEPVDPGSHATTFLLQQAIPFNVGCHRGWRPWQEPDRHRPRHEVRPPYPRAARWARRGRDGQPLLRRPSNPPPPYPTRSEAIAASTTFVLGSNSSVSPPASTITTRRPVTNTVTQNASVRPSAATS